MSQPPNVPGWPSHTAESHVAFKATSQPLSVTPSSLLHCAISHHFFTTGLATSLLADQSSEGHNVNTSSIAVIIITSITLR